MKHGQRFIQDRKQGRQEGKQKSREEEEEEEDFIDSYDAEPPGVAGVTTTARGSNFTEQSERQRCGLQTLFGVLTPPSRPSQVGIHHPTPATQPPPAPAFSLRLHPSEETLFNQEHVLHVGVFNSNLTAELCSCRPAGSTHRGSK